MSSAAIPEHPWLLPASLTAAADRRNPRRSTRDWIVDTLCFLLSLLFALYAMDDAKQPESIIGIGNNGPPWLPDADALAGLAVCCALWLRRRWPVGLAVATLPIGLFSITAAVAQMIILFTVIVHRRLAVSGGLAAAAVAGGLVFNEIRPDQALSRLETLFWNVAIVGSVLAWGMFVRARRQLILSLRDRADRAEAEQHLRVAQARHLERTRIAREMHDVLAHRISLLSLHAGALEFRPQAPPEEVARAAGVIRSSAHAALQDLREVIGVLREDVPGAPEAAPERPQPTLADLVGLVTESREAGMRVDLRETVTDAANVPAGIGRSAYRIVQEALTNARKHAAGARVAVEVTGGPGAGLTVEVRNPSPVAEPHTPGMAGMAGVGMAGAGMVGTGTGLVGLGERVSLVGGRLQHGRTATGAFRLSAWMPWPV